MTVAVAIGEVLVDPSEAEIVCAQCVLDVVFDSDHLSDKDSCSLLAVSQVRVVVGRVAFVV